MQSGEKSAHIKSATAVYELKNIQDIIRKDILTPLQSHRHPFALNGRDGRENSNEGNSAAFKLPQESHHYAVIQPA